MNEQGQSAPQTAIGLQFSVYALHQDHMRPAVEAAVRAAAEAGVDVTTGRLSTSGTGEEEAVFAAVREAFAAARSFGPTVMVVTLASDPPSEATVTDIQRMAAV